MKRVAKTIAVSEKRQEQLRKSLSSAEAARREYETNMLNVTVKTAAYDKKMKALKK